MSYGANPYILFLILILLVLGMDPEASNKIQVVKNVMDRMSSAINNFRSGIDSMAADFGEIHVMLRGLNMFGGGGDK
ncbi:MAG: hypothetical protein K6T66_11690 [Peptococcaceae bacterium]|nr:hypothetical protein [Peptococcaceae bacterium]